MARVYADNAGDILSVEDPSPGSVPVGAVVFVDFHGATNADLLTDLEANPADYSIESGVLLHLGDPVEFAGSGGGGAGSGYTAEQIYDLTAATFAEGTRITLGKSDIDNTITVSTTAVSDHGALTGLTDNDHPYPLVDTQLDSLKPGATTANRVLQPGSSGAWDDVFVGHPRLIEQGGTVYMFYGGLDGTISQGGVATASAAGFTGLSFTKYGSNPILVVGAGGSWDASHVGSCAVIYDEDATLWKMWYTGTNAGGTQAIGYATASNPLGPWTKYVSNPVLSPAVAWEGTQLHYCSVLRESATSYKMLYGGGDFLTGSTGRIGMATSSDGITWTKYASNPVISPSGSGWMQRAVFSPRTLIKVGSVYHLYFTGKAVGGMEYSSIGYAQSTDLITWVMGANNPVITSTRAWENGEVEHPSVLHLGRNYFVYYDAWYGNSIGVTILPD